LERNEIVGITVDGGGGKRVATLRFLGRPAGFQTGAVDLALSTEAAIVPAFVLSEPGLRHRLIISPALQLDPKKGKEENRREVMQQFATLLESLVRRYPDHYGYTLCLRSQRARLDAFPFFADYGTPLPARTAGADGQAPEPQART
jgi:KDO2-lipid IV(A) lauroyltransferase